MERSRALSFIDATDVRFVESTSWMSFSTYKDLWENALQHCNGTCTVEDDMMDRKSLLQLLGNNIIEVSESTKEELSLNCYGNICDAFGETNLVLILLERLCNSQNVVITVKAADSIKQETLQNILRIIQQKIHPEDSPPMAPRARSATLNDNFHPSTETIPTRPDENDKVHLHENQMTVSSPNLQKEKFRDLVKSRNSTESLDELGGTRARSNTVRYTASSGISFEGYLRKKNEILPTWKECYCVLEANTFAYYESKEDFMNNCKLRGRSVIQHIEIENIGRPNGFVLTTEGHRNQHFVSRTSFETEQWLRAIRIAIARESKLRRDDPIVAFASQELNIPEFYELLGQLLREERTDFPTLLRSIHPDVVVTSNYPPIVPFWGQYRRYDGLLLYISALIETVEVEKFMLNEVKSRDMVRVESTSSGVKEKTCFVVTGKESLRIKNNRERSITQIFVHQLYLDYKKRLIRWHIEGDSIALSVAFDSFGRGDLMNLKLPGADKSVEDVVPPGIVYIQVVRGQDIRPPVVKTDTYAYYVRCSIDQGVNSDRTHSGLCSANIETKRRVSLNWVRGLKRAAGISGERAFNEFSDGNGVVTHILRQDSCSPEWKSNLRIAFPGSSPGSSYYLKVSVYHSRFLLNDELLGVCKINLAPYLNLANASAEAQANGAIPQWYKLCDKFIDCKEWWAPPTVFCGNIQIGIVFGKSYNNNNNNNNNNNQLRGMDLHHQSKEQSSTSTIGDVVLGLRSSEFLEAPGFHNIVSSSTLMGKSGVRDNHLVPAGNHLFDIPKKYELVKVIGSGAYGIVIAATDTHAGITIAIKKISDVFRDLLDTKRILRELRLLRQLNHKYIVSLRDVLRPRAIQNMNDLYIVTDLMESDLHRVINSSQILSDDYVSYFIFQILCGLKYLHSAWVIHRDLKPSNILVNSNCEIKICDLGLAKGLASSPLESSDDLTQYVVTRWYRAPEVLLDGTKYGASIDVWAAGCIMAELLGRKPIFPGKSTANQILKILDVVGTPEDDLLDRLIKPVAAKWMRKQAWRPKLQFRDFYPDANGVALDLLDKLLTFDWNKRITVEEALKHPYLAEHARKLQNDNCTFQGVLDLSHELVDDESKMALQEALLEDIYFFHPEARKEMTPLTIDNDPIYLQTRPQGINEDDL